MLNQNDFLNLLNLEIEKFKSTVHPSLVADAADYALKGQGKRFRPLLIHSLVSDEVNHSDLIYASMALECIHTYSLVHDDLPALDNDDYRRGRLTAHKVFSEATAILAGDALLTHAFSYILKMNIEDKDKLLMIEYLIKAAGLNGMILGQDLDLSNALSQQFDTSKIKQLYELKTGALFGCAMVYSQILTHSYSNLDRIYQLGLKLGLLFQIQDDYLEKFGDPNLLGKSNNSDLINEKKTLMGDRKQEEIEAYLLKSFDELKHDIIVMHSPHERFIDLIDNMIQRRY